MIAHPRIGRWSTYTVLGFTGYVVASALGAWLSIVWELSLGERLVALVAPPVAFIAVVTVASALRGREWIVFYQAACGAVVAAIIGSLAVGGSVARTIDIVVLGIGAFLVLGRIGCFHVACCHGRPSRRGVTYGADHTVLGLWKPLEGRALLPVQLVESAASAVLVAIGLLASSEPGRAAAVYAAGYACTRFTLELLRGDPVRPFARGLSEAQWWSIACAAAVAVIYPAWWTVTAAAGIAAAAGYLVATRARRELVALSHLREIDRLAGEVHADPQHARRETSRGVGVSFHALPDGRVDWILSSSDARWSTTIAATIAALLWPGSELVEGRTPGVIHVIHAPSTTDTGTPRASAPSRNAASPGSSS